MYTLKSMVRRGTSFAAMVAIVAATVMPAVSVSADALNPLTERSLTLSSGSPGWSYTDGSGNATYAPPNSGANGNKTGNTFSFRVSSTADPHAISFQYCTTSAGYCKAPGNNDTSGTSPSLTRAANGQTQYALKHSDLDVQLSSPSEVSTFGSKFDATSGQPTNAANVPNRDNSEGNYIVLTKSTAGASWTQNTGWTMTASNKEDCQGGSGATCVGTGDATGKNNYITLKNASGLAGLTAGSYVKVIFFGTDTNYITNPGADAFFVKINTYNSDTTQDNTTVIDGGVTVANVMNQSIEIQTKVLETMDFSVGTVDPNTLDSTGGAGSEFALATGRPTHGVCDAVVPALTAASTAKNVLQMGNETGENSLETGHTYSTHSYWRLSSNSSAGATVYYSGVTLSNTVGDQIKPIGVTKASPTVGSEQFGLALDNGDNTDYSGASGPNWTGYPVVYGQERTTNKVYEDAADNGKTSIHTASLTADGVLSNGSWHAPRLSPLAPESNYGGGSGVINSDYIVAGGDPTDDSVNTKYAFDPNSNLIPTPLASESSSVVDCVTGKVRYIANIAATTPAGIYTTKVNYIAAPQY